MNSSSDSTWNWETVNECQLLRCYTVRTLFSCDCVPAVEGWDGGRRLRNLIMYFYYEHISALFIGTHHHQYTTLWLSPPLSMNKWWNSIWLHYKFSIWMPFLFQAVIISHSYLCHSKGGDCQQSFVLESLSSSSFSPSVSWLGGRIRTWSLFLWQR